MVIWNCHVSISLSQPVSNILIPCARQYYWSVLIPPQPAWSRHTKRYQSTKLTKRTASPVPNTETSVGHCFQGLRNALRTFLVMSKSINKILLAYHCKLSSSMRHNPEKFYECGSLLPDNDVHLSQVVFLDVCTKHEQLM